MAIYGYQACKVKRLQKSLIIPVEPEKNQTMQSTRTENTQFANDVLTGLGKTSKSIPSKYFYDAEGDRIFQQIMDMPEYYITGCEYEILYRQTPEILDAVDAFDRPLNLIEFGAGDGLKTKILLKYLSDQEAQCTYHPVDISNSILVDLSRSLAAELPSIQVAPLNLDYFQALKEMDKLSNRRNLILFLGSNIGNFSERETLDFLGKIWENSKDGDMFLMGVDLKKDPQVIIDAYDDPHGITAAFNMNLLARMNRELGADFDLKLFEHYTYYNEESGEIRSYLKSLKKQSVFFSDLNQSFDFAGDELIHTEISRKYSLEELESFAAQLGFEIVSHFLDSRNYFADTLWQVRK
jgi:dimethylhistidine N-methyltransferase